MQPEEYHKHVLKRGRWMKKIFFIFFTIFIIFPLVAFFAYPFISGPAENFKTGEVFEIKKGMGVSEIADFLEEKGYIKSATIFKLYDKWDSYKTKNYSGIKAGKYTFKNKLDVFGVYHKLKNGESGIDNISITILEGEPNFLIAKKYARKFKGISEKKFLELAKDYEGYLYPDTYSFSPYVTEDTVIKTMKKNFYKKAGKIVSEINKSNKSLGKILTMASLIEKEAGNASMKTKKHISGILWRRIKKDIPLQVDAVFAYIYKRHLPRTMYSHLKVDSPYNVYKNKGLPPTPIGNPSVDSITAAMYPTTTTDLFYLTGKDGKFYYAKTGVQHNVNKAKYITNYKAPVVETEEKVEGISEL